MKTTKYTFSFFTLLKYGGQAFAFLLFTFSLSFAQVEEQPKVEDKSEVNSTNSTQTDGEKVSIKDGTTTMVEFISQGSSGLIHLPSLGTLVSFPGDNLYNSGGSLYWGGSKLGTSSSAAGWSYSGSNIYTTTLSNKVGIGTSNPQSKLSVGGLGNSSAAISGDATTGWGVYGKATTGRGVFGSANGTDGEGVIAEAHGENGRAISGYASGVNGLAGNFVGDVNISGSTTIGNDIEISGSTTISDNIEISGSTKLGTTGTPFLEIREISGITGPSNSIHTTLPNGWTGANTRVLSLAIFGGNFDGNNYWYTQGNGISARLSIGTNMAIFYPDNTYYYNKPWRAVIMRMP